MDIIIFPWERVVEINTIILETEPGMKGSIDIEKLKSALGRIDNFICYEDLNDVFEIAANYAIAIAVSHALPDANKRTGLMVALEYLSLNDFEIEIDNDNLAEVMVDTVLYKLDANDLADILYSAYCVN
jgi:death-on-curing protein